MSYIIFPLFLWAANLQLSLMAVFGLTKHVGPWSKRLIEKLQPRLLEAVKPQIIVISAGEENKYDHPHPEFLQRAQEIGADVLRTDELGTIEIISDGQRVWWKLER